MKVPITIEPNSGTKYAGKIVWNTDMCDTQAFLIHYVGRDQIFGRWHTEEWDNTHPLYKGNDTDGMLGMYKWFDFVGTEPEYEMIDYNGAIEELDSILYCEDEDSKQKQLELLLARMKYWKDLNEGR